MKRQQKGFTLVEVALVLAIAGLIFLMIFVALPTLQRQARDAQRESDMAKFVDMVKKFQTNNRGALPSGSDPVTGENVSEGGNSWGGFYFDYLGKNFVDPLGPNYNLVIYQCGEGFAGDKCKDNDVNNMVSSLNNGTFEDNNNTLHVVVQAKCASDMETGVVAASTVRNMAVLYRLEGGGGIHCENN